MFQFTFEAVGWVYLIGAERTGMIKIGWTMAHPDERLRQLQLMSPAKLLPMGLMPGPFSLEKSLHRRFAEHRDHGEWFRLCDEILDYVGPRLIRWLERGDIAIAEDALKFQMRTRPELAAEMMREWNEAEMARLWNSVGKATCRREGAEADDVARQRRIADDVARRREGAT